MDFLKKSIEIVFSPLGVTVILIGLGILFSCTEKHLRLGRKLLICGGLLFLILLFSPLSEYLVLRLERDYRPMLKPPASIKIDRIVILAGYAEQSRNFPITTVVSEETICRISEGLRLYRLLPGAKMIVSGGVVRKGDQPVAASMSELLQQIGVPIQDILVEGSSENTYENLVQVKKMVGSQPFILVTQACDLRRAMAVARKLHMNPVPAPACNWVLQYHTNSSTSEGMVRHLSAFLYPSSKNLSMIQWAYHEYVGYAWYRLLGRI